MDESKSSSQHESNKSRYISPVKPMFDKFSKQKDVTFIYGEPIEFKNQCIVPVAKANYSFGGGGGSGASKRDGEGQGEGSGGIVSVKPLGVYNISANRVRFKPILDLKLILTAFSGITLGLALLLRRK